jgi:tRNA (guanosine-2'-O-)-methyltransferase
MAVSVEMEDSKNLYDYLTGFLSNERREKFERYVALRTRYVTIAVEDIFQPHNASAVLRSAECFGVQDIHVIENRNKYNPNPDIVLGANKWLTLHRYGGTENNTRSCISALRKNGYRIVATTPHKNDRLVNELDLSKGKVALFFGTELEGISNDVLEEADEFVKIPMYGFTESFNISVSAAICLYELLPKLRESDLPWQLSAAEKTTLLLDWAKASLTRPDLLEQAFRDRT